MPFEGYISKWSQLGFLLSFSIGNSKFNLKGDVILFVVYGDLQVQEKLFKILILPKVAIQKLVPLCCSSIFIMTRALPKAAILKLMQNIQLFHFPSLHRNPKVTIKSWFPYAAVQYSWWPMANNSKVDSSVLPKLRFWGWCKIPSCSFPIVALQSNIPNANIKHLQIPDYSFCCGCICRNNQVQEKIVQSLSVFLMAKIDFLSSGLSFFFLS